MGVMNVSDEEELVRAVWALLQFPSQMRSHESFITGILVFSTMSSRASCFLGLLGTVFLSHWGLPYKEL